MKVFADLVAVLIILAAVFGVILLPFVAFVAFLRWAI